MQVVKLDQGNRHSNSKKGPRYSTQPCAFLSGCAGWMGIKVARFDYSNAAAVRFACLIKAHMKPTFACVCAHSLKWSLCIQRCVYQWSVQRDGCAECGSVHRLYRPPATHLHAWPALVSPVRNHVARLRNRNTYLMHHPLMHECLLLERTGSMMLSASAQGTQKFQTPKFSLNKWLSIALLQNRKYFLMINKHLLENCQQNNTN